MAKVPTIGIGSTQLANPRLTTTAPQAEQTQTLGVGKGVASFGGALETTSDAMYKKLDEARNYTEIAQAEADDAKFRADELLRAETQVDSMGRPYQGSLKDSGYEERARKQAEKVAGYFSSKETQARYSAMNAKNSIVTGAEIQRKFYANMIDAGKAATIDRITAATQRYANAPDSLQVVNGVPQLSKKLYADQINGTIKDAVAKGFLTETAAQKLRYDALQDAGFLSFQVDLAKDRKTATANLESGKYGLDTENTLKAEAKLKAKTQELRAAQIETRALGNDLLVSGELTEGWINEQVKLNKEDPLMGFPQIDGLRLKKALYGDVKQRMTALSASNKTASKYKKAIDTVFSSNVQDQMFAYDAVLDAYSDGAISKDEMSFFNSIIKTQKDINWNAKSGIMHSAINLVKAAFGTPVYASDDAVNGLRNMMVKIQDGKEPTIAAREVIKEKIQAEHPSAVLDDKIPQATYSQSKGFQNTGSSEKSKSALVFDPKTRKFVPRNGA